MCIYKSLKSAHIWFGMGFTLDALPNTILPGICISSSCLFIHLEKFEKFPPCRKQGNKHTREHTMSNPSLGHRAQKMAGRHIKESSAEPQCKKRERDKEEQYEEIWFARIHIWITPRRPERKVQATGDWAKVSPYFVFLPYTVPFSDYILL